MERREGWLQVKRVNMIVACVVGLLAIIGTVFATVRIGVRTEVHYEFEQQIAEPKSDLNRHLEQRLDAALKEDHGELTSRLRAVEKDLAVVRTTVENQAEDLGELKVDVKELLRRSR